MYVGSMVLKALLLVDSWKEHMNDGEGSLLDNARFFWTRFIDWGLFINCLKCFSLEKLYRSHLNHFMEYYSKQNNNLTKAVMVVGLQLAYTVVFGSYASFLFVRTGHLLAPLVAHVFCNFMGLPVLFSRRRGVVCLGFVVGMVGFLWLLFPMTSPHLFNERTNYNCRCWHGYCYWH